MRWDEKMNKLKIYIPASFNYPAFISGYEGQYNGVHNDQIGLVMIEYNFCSITNKMKYKNFIHFHFIHNIRWNSLGSNILENESNWISCGNNLI